MRMLGRDHTSSGKPCASSLSPHPHELTHQLLHYSTALVTWCVSPAAAFSISLFYFPPSSIILFILTYACPLFPHPASCGTSLQDILHDFSRGKPSSVFPRPLSPQDMHYTEECALCLSPLPKLWHTFGSASQGEARAGGTKTRGEDQATDSDF